MNIKIVKNKNSLTAFYLEYLGHKNKFYEDFFFRIIQCITFPALITSNILSTKYVLTQQDVIAHIVSHILL